MKQEMIAKFFEFRTAYKAASKRRYARRDEISREFGVGLGEAQNHPDYKVLDAEATRLYWEADALTPHLIRANLQNFGVDDMVVTGVSHYADTQVIAPGQVRLGDGREIGRAEMLLSDLCGLRYLGMAKKFGVEPKGVSLRIHVEKDGKHIGGIDSDANFTFEAAPDLRTALGWKIASDGGRERLVEFFSLDQAVSSILETIRTAGTGKEAFFGAYFEVLKRVFVYERTTRFGDGYCGAATILWRVATRELGEEHAGYPFAF